jgi:hypothetical protein
MVFADYVLLMDMWNSGVVLRFRPPKGSLKLIVSLKI